MPPPVNDTATAWSDMSVYQAHRIVVYKKKIAGVRRIIPHNSDLARCDRPTVTV